MKKRSQSPSASRSKRGELALNKNAKRMGDTKSSPPSQNQSLWRNEKAKDQSVTYLASQIPQKSQQNRQTTTKSSAINDEDSDLLNPFELKNSLDVFMLVRDTFLPRNLKLRQALNMNPRDDPIINQLQLIDKITTKSDLYALSQFSQELKIENLKLGEQIKAATSSRDMTVKAVSSKVEIMHKSLFNDHEHNDEINHAQNSPSSRGLLPVRSKRQPWHVAPMDEEFNPYRDEELAEDFWEVISTEVIEEFYGTLIQGSVDVVAKEEEWALSQKKERRHSSISVHSHRRESVKVSVLPSPPPLASSQGSPSDTPAFMLPVGATLSKRAEGIKQRLENKKKLDLLSSGMRSCFGETFAGTPPPPVSSGGKDNANLWPSHPVIKSSMTVTAKKRNDAFETFMTKGYGLENDTPRFMKVVKETNATSDAKAKKLIRSWLGRSVFDEQQTGGAKLTTDVSTEMEKELMNLEKTLGLKSRASLHFAQSPKM